MKFSRLIFANLFRKKIRLILTIGSFAVALFLFSFLAVVKGAFGRGADIAGADRLVIILTNDIGRPIRVSGQVRIGIVIGHESRGSGAQRQFVTGSITGVRHMDQISRHGCLFNIGDQFILLPVFHGV